jgi:hypothetical protein
MRFGPQRLRVSLAAYDCFDHLGFPPSRTLDEVPELDRIDLGINFEERKASGSDGDAAIVGAVLGKWDCWVSTGRAGAAALPRRAVERI